MFISVEVKSYVMPAKTLLVGKDGTAQKLGLMKAVGFFGADFT